MLRRGQPLSRRLRLERPEGYREVTCPGCIGGVEGDKSRQNLVRPALGVLLESHDAADVWGDAAGCRYRVAAYLEPGLRQSVRQGPGKPRTDDRHLVEALGEIRQQPNRELDAVDRFRREVGRAYQGSF